MLATVWKRTTFVFAATALAALMTIGAAAQSPTAVEVAITGNDHISAEAILASVSLKSGAEATPEVIEKDREAINAMGYFSEVSARTEEATGGVKVIYDVVENPVIKAVKLEGVGPVPEKDLLAILRTRPDNVLNNKTIEQDIEAIRRYYRDKGYLADVEDVSIDKEAGSLTIPIVVNVVQTIDIVGNKKTPDYVFTREMKTKPGQYLNVNQLRRDILNIYDLNILERENAQEPRYEPGSEVGKVIVTIPVQERKTGQISLGIGYSSGQKFVGRAELTEINFRGRGQGVNIMWEVAGESQGSSFDVRFFEPWLDSKHTSLDVSVFDKLVYRFTSNALTGGSELDDDYNERRKGAQLGFGRPIDDFHKGSVSFRGESVKVDVPDSILTDETNSLLPVSEDGNVYSTTLKWIGNTRDFDLDPAVGTLKSVSLEVGTATRNGFVWNSANSIYEYTRLGEGGFTKSIVDYRRYFSHKGRKMNVNDKRRTIAFRLMFGVESGTILFSEQFFVGGAESVRGYREDRFWGTKMVVANVEYRMPVANSLTGVLFADWGGAWDGIQALLATGEPIPDFDQDSDFAPVSSVGVGIRVSTPIGNLRLDYGVGSEGSRTHFSIGQAF